MKYPHAFDLQEFLDEADLFDPDTGDLTEDAEELLADDDRRRRFV